MGVGDWLTPRTKDFTGSVLDFKKLRALLSGLPRIVRHFHLQHLSGYTAQYLRRMARQGSIQAMVLVSGCTTEKVEG